MTSKKSWPKVAFYYLARLTVRFNCVATRSMTFKLPLCPIVTDVVLPNLPFLMDPLLHWVMVVDMEIYSHVPSNNTTYYALVFTG